MKPKKICPLCGKSMAANHWWKVGQGWQCKKAVTPEPINKQTDRPQHESKAYITDAAASMGIEHLVGRPRRK